MQLELDRAGSRYENNPYYHPDKHGLEIVDEYDFSSGDYCFDLVVVWRKLSDGTIWYDRDAGCSCPSPFEDTTQLERLFSFDVLQEMRKADDKYGTIESWENFRRSVMTALERLREQ